MSVEVVLLVIVTIVVLVVWTLISMNEKKRDKEYEDSNCAPLAHHKSVTIVPEINTSGEGSDAVKDVEPLTETLAEHKPTPRMSAPVSSQRRKKMVKKGGGFNAMPVRIVITGILLIAALVVILSNNYDGDSKNWAFGVVGTILGYWLKADKS